MSIARLKAFSNDLYLEMEMFKKITQTFARSVVPAVPSPSVG